MTKASQELDMRISREIFGYTLVKHGDEYFELTPNGERALRAYSRDIGAAWDVAEKLNITLIPIAGGTWFTIVGKHMGWRSPAEFIEYLRKGDFVSAGAAISETPALSICLAGISSVEKSRLQDHHQNRSIAQ